MFKPCTVVIKNGTLYEGRIVQEYKNHIIFEDHEYGLFEIIIEEIIEISYV